MNKYGEDVEEPHACGGFVTFYACDSSVLGTESVSVSLHPDEARLLALRLIKMADEAEDQEW